jgi:hypothetical protein
MQRKRFHEGIKMKITSTYDFLKTEIIVRFDVNINNGIIGFNSF